MRRSSGRGPTRPTLIILYDRQKLGTAIVHYYVFSLAGPRENNLCLPFG